MTIKDLGKIDIAYETSDGVTGLVAVATDWEPESLRLAQLAVKLDAMRSYGETNPPYRIEVVCYESEPPESAVALVRSVGGAVNRENSMPATGRPGRYRPDEFGELDWPAIHAANAALFAGRHGLDGTVDSLTRLDAVLAESYAAAVRDGDDGETPAHEDGDLAVLAGAYASEVLISAYGGDWHPSEDHLPDMRIRLGDDGHLVVAAAGKVRKFLQGGPADAVAPLARVIAEHL